MENQKSETSLNNEDSFNVSGINTQLKIWGERLLDLTKGNPL